MGFDEGKRDDCRRLPLSAQLGKDARADGRQSGGQIAHGDRRVDRRTKASRGDASNRFATVMGGEQYRAAAHGRTAFRAQADTPSGGSGLKLFENHLSAWKAPGARAAALADLLNGPGKSTLHGSRRLVEV